MFGIGAQEMVFLAIIALLVFGPKRLPELARTLGKGMAEFRRASADLRGALSMEADAAPSARRETADPRENRDLAPPEQMGEGVPPAPVPEPAAASDDGTAEREAAEAAVLAELADEANDEKHRHPADGGGPGPQPTPVEPPADERQGQLFASDAPDASEPATADEPEPHDGPPGTVPAKAARD